VTEVDPARGVDGRTLEEMLAEHRVDRYGLIWRLCRDGGMATRSDDIGIISIGIRVLEQLHGPLTDLTLEVEGVEAS
jgi:hypothetical protein